jgi:hypothetical protein
MMNYRKMTLLAIFVSLQACAISPAVYSKVASETPKDLKGDRSALSDVNTSEVKRSPKPKNPEVCSLENDKSFFTSFVKGKNNRGVDRNVYTASKVEIRNYDDPSELLEVRNKENYDGFRIGFIDYMAFYLDPIKNPSDYENVTFDVTRRDPKAFRVDYSKAEYVDAEQTNTLIRTYGTHGAYIFEHRDGCWHLTQELRSDSPETKKSSKSMQFVKQNFSPPLLDQVYKSFRECVTQYVSTTFSPCAHRIYYFSDLVLSHDLLGTESSTITLIPYESAFSQQQALSYSKILAEKLKIDFENPEFQEGKTTYSGCLYDLSGGALTPLCHIELKLTPNKTVSRVVLTIKSP